MSEDLVKRLRLGNETHVDARLEMFEAADRIEELSNCVAVLEAKLEKAVGALDKIKRIDNLVGVFAACERTLAELTGGKDE